MQVHHGQQFPRILFIASISKKHSNIQTSEEKRRKKRKEQQAGRKNKVGIILHRSGEATNPGPAQFQ
eukprot:14281596-Heterocapsa_arctica.AAC.1